MTDSLAFIKRVLVKLLVTAMVGAFAQGWAAPPVIDGDGGEIVEPPHSGPWDGSLRVNGANSDFNMERHGFRFGNSWDDLHINLPEPFGDVDLETESFGLCGGMIYAAHDSFYMESTSGRLVYTPGNEPLPEPESKTKTEIRRNEVPGPGSELRKYIWNRQMDSLKR
ncbi:MAG: hypothetical protein OEU36_24935, partial [Gammaproteobacteria bacterium]|nr:hypothetical protein [Gammaproteobacteria bacterium]